MKTTEHMHCMQLVRMINKEFIKVLSHILVNIALFLIYAQYFGQQSVKKYLDQGVTIVEYKETPSAIPQPGT